MNTVNNVIIETALAIQNAPVSFPASLSPHLGLHSNMTLNFVKREDIAPWVIKNYKPERLHQRDEHTPGYSDAIIDSYWKSINLYRKVYISRFESITGEVIKESIENFIN